MRYRQIKHLASPAVLVSLLALPVASLGGQQPGADMLPIEVAAFHAFFRLENIDVPRSAVALDPRLGATGAQSGEGGLSSRPAAHTAALARALGAKIIRSDSALACQDSYCRYSGADAIVSISSPVMVEDTAFVTVTANYNSPHRPRTEYIAARFALLRFEGRWKAVRYDILGQS